MAKISKKQINKLKKLIVDYEETSWKAGWCAGVLFRPESTPDINDETALDFSKSIIRRDKIEAALMDIINGIKT